MSNYYQYAHQRRARISISGLHDFIRQRVANEESADPKYCQIVDAHYFRGRLRAQAAEQRDMLFRERTFDDVLMREGVTTHYLPLGPDGEKGIDVWLSLEAYEMAIYKRFDVTVLVACDGDFLPLVRKLNTLGSRVMLLGWDFKYTDKNGQERETRTAQVLLREAAYPVMMHQIIDDLARKGDPLIDNLFVPQREARIRESAREEAALTEAPAPSLLRGQIQALKEGFGFITPDGGGSNIFFFHADVVTPDFNELQVGNRVEYEMGTNAKGPCAVNVRVSEPIA